MVDTVLTGLDGTNPLAFMAALGVLDALTRRSAERHPREQPSLSWVNTGLWRPVLRAPLAPDDIVRELLHDLESFKDEPALALRYSKTSKGEGDDEQPTKHAWDLKPPPRVFREYLQGLVATSSADARRSVDFAAAFATDVATDNNGNTKPTALHFTAGQQEFLRMVNELVHGTGREPAVGEADIREAIFGPWQYARPLAVLQWDATASRDYALRASDPSKDKKLGVPGADWLAFRGLPFFRAVPVGLRVATTGCGGGWKTGYLRWVLWSGWLTAAAAGTVLAQAWTARSASEREARGIVLSLESSIRRSDQGGYGSFAPSRIG